MSDGPRVHEVLTVCLGNICRSPTAEAAILEAAEREGVAVRVRSAGTGSWHLGDPPDPRMIAAARALDLHLDGASELVTAAHLSTADLVLAMDRSNLADLERLAAANGTSTPIRLFRAFDDASLVAGELEVPDPYTGGPAGFTHVVELCRAAATGVVEHLDGRRPDPGPR